MTRADLERIAASVCGEKPAAIVVASDLYATVAPLLLGRETEALVVVAVNRRLSIVSAEVLTTGNDGFTIVCPKQIFRWALTRKRPVHAIALAHNHPSGDKTPSSQDYEVTRRVKAAGRVLGIELLDHLVVGGPMEYTSMQEAGGF